MHIVRSSMAVLCNACRPWDAPQNVLNDAGVELGSNYEWPIISLEESRTQVRDRSCFPQARRCFELASLYMALPIGLDINVSCSSTVAAQVAYACSVIERSITGRSGGESKEPYRVPTAPMSDTPLHPGCSAPSNAKCVSSFSRPSSAGTGFP